MNATAVGPAVTSLLEVNVAVTLKPAVATAACAGMTETAAMAAATRVEISYMAISVGVAEDQVVT